MWFVCISVCFLEGGTEKQQHESQSGQSYTSTGLKFGWGFCKYVKVLYRQVFNRVKYPIFTKLSKY